MFNLTKHLVGKESDMNFDVQDLALLEAIERNGSFSAAAEELYRTRSAITHHIKKLEEQLGFQLFDRTQYRPSLTPEGQLFLERARPLLRNLERLKSEVQHIKQGWDSEFRIAIDDLLAPENLFFIIEEFRTIAPSVNIRITREVLNGCWDALLEDRATLAIGTSGDPPLELICGQRSLGVIDFAFAVARDHPLTHVSPPVPHEMLEAHPSIVISDTSQSIAKRSSGSISRQTKIIVPTMESKIRAQVFGLGIGYLPRLRIQALLNEGLLVELEVTHQAKRSGPLKIAWQSTSTSPTLAWFLEALNSENVLKKVMGENI